MELLEFLKLVLPTKGHYCWVTIQNKKVVQGFLPTIEELSVKLSEEDKKGRDTYFACSSFKEPGSRKADNVLCTKAFWLDIDAGEGKPYKDADAAFEAVEFFCNKTGLPPATIVGSGNGIHCWWPLDKELESKEWKEYAESIKELARHNGLDADPSRTADVASILRPPGTRNFKNGKSSEVILWELSDSSNVHKFTPELFNRRTNIDVVRDWDKIKEKENDYSLEKGFPDGHRTQALMARVGHLLSPACNFTETQCLEAILQWNKLNTPPKPESEIRSTVASVARSERKKREALASEVGELPKLPAGYKWDGRGRMITSVPIKDTEEWEEIAVTRFPLYLESISKKERGTSQAYTFQQWLPKEGWREFQINCKDYDGMGWKGCFAEHIGSCILNDKLFRAYVGNADENLRRVQMDTTRYTQFGWKDDDKSFLVGDVIIHQGGKIERALGDGDLANKMKLMSPNKNGSLESWSADANRLFGDNFVHFGYVLVASFAATLLKLCMDESDGGIILSVVSTGSGHGKTKLLEAGTSVWGKLESLQLGGRDTTNALFSKITTACNLPVFMDEWNERDPSILGKFIKQFTVGHDKSRAQKDGSVISKLSSYKTLMVVTSNHSLYDIAKSTGDEGVIARLIEIQAPAMSREDIDRLGKITSNMLNNSSWAGREFIYQLMQPGELEIAKRLLEEATTKIRDDLKTEGKHRYVAWLPAAIWIAGYLLNRYKILEFDYKRIKDWSISESMKRINEVSAATPVEVLSMFITEHAGNCLMVNGPYKTGGNITILNASSLPPVKVLMRSERDTKRLYIPGSTFGDWCLKHGHSYRNILDSLLKDKVIINKNKLTTLTAGTNAGTGRIRCLEIDTGNELITGEQLESVQST